jgi:hypothetical protein
VGALAGVSFACVPAAGAIHAVAGLILIIVVSGCIQTHRIHRPRHSLTRMEVLG